MSFVRALVAGGAPSRFVTRVAVSRPSVVLANRLLSTTTCRSASESSLGHSHGKKDYLDDNVAPRSPSGQHTAMATAADEPEKDFNPYKDGPSAIDKAVHLFFFTEILRGSFNSHNFTVMMLMLLIRDVDCPRTVLPATIYDHVSF